MLTPEEIIRMLSLVPHPEGGHYREVYRSDMPVEHPEVTPGKELRRSAVTSIYYLLEAGDFSTLHRVRSDETWHLYGGGPLEIHLIDQHGDYRCEVLGHDLGAGFRPQLTIPSNTWQGARPAPGAPYALCGCTVAPGFEFADFSLAGRRELLLCYPHCEDIIRELTRE